MDAAGQADLPGNLPPVDGPRTLRVVTPRSFIAHALTTAVRNTARMRRPNIQSGIFHNHSIALFTVVWNVISCEIYFRLFGFEQAWFRRFPL